MPHGARLSRDLREVIIFMRGVLKNSQIIEYTGIPKSTVNKILHDYDKTGRIAESPERCNPKTRKPKSKLTDGDVDVSGFPLKRFL